MSKLNDREDLFCLEYLIDLNGKQAAIRAGYSEKSATSKASQLLTKVNVQDRIQQLQKNTQKRTEVTTDKVIKELANIGFSNIADVLDVSITASSDSLTGEESEEELLNALAGSNNWVTLKDGKDLKDLPRNVSSLISEIKQTKDGLSIKLYDKLNAIDKLMKHLGMFEKDNKQKENITQITTFELPKNDRE